MIRIAYILSITVLMLLSAELSAQAKLTASVSKSTVAVNQSFRLTFTLQGGQNGKLKPPSLEGFTAYGPSQSTNMSIMNGNVSQSISWTYTLQPTKEGTFTIGKATCTAGGKTLESKPITIKVVKANSKTNTTNNGQPSEEEIRQQIKENLFVRVYADKTEAYVGEQVTVSYKVFSRVTNSAINYAEAPSFGGFWVHDFQTENQYKVEVVDGVRYNTLVIKKVALFPQRSGELDIPAMALTTSVRIQVKRQPRTYMDQFFGAYDYKTIPFTFRSGTVNLNVKALPSADQPKDFTGLVGQYDLTADISESQTDAGNPITLSFSLKGRGNISMLELPELDLDPSFQIYTPQIDRQVSTAGGVVNGSIQYDYLLLPETTGDYAIELPAISYFDPKQEVYEVLDVPTFDVKITGESIQQDGDGVTKEDIDFVEQDIRYLKLNSGSSYQSVPFLTVGVASTWIVPVLGLVGFLITVRHRRKQGADVVAMRKSRARKMAMKRLDTASVKMKEGDQKGFYDEVIRSIWGYLSDKLTIPRSELSKENIQNILYKNGTEEETVKRLVDLLSNCEMALFAPSTAGMDMSETFESAAALIIELETVQQ